MHPLDLRHLLRHELHLWLLEVLTWFLAPGGWAGLLVATVGSGLRVEGLLSSCPSSVPPTPPDVQSTSVWRLLQRWFSSG